MATENVKVAVRVRPFSTREKNRKSQLIVKMEKNTTLLINPEDLKSDPRKFTFDHSYWSHDGFEEDAAGYCKPVDPKYIDQLKMFNELGKGMLANAWSGYNCSIFAYGQTGSGKSYSIMGHGANKGLVPRVCEHLFQEIESKKGKGATFEVTFSMLEIYNEHVRDLLNKKKTTQGGLLVKERAQKGFYVEGLNIVPVGNYEDIKLRMNEGDRQRTIAATKMNETSSRAHTIVTVTFKQNDVKSKTSKISSINLVDLAGSERAKQTEATGDRFEEAKNINKSLMTLGNVIKALCDKAKQKTAHIPYRDSVLTKLLKNALGGNSKTLMIAAISPDAENYDQTLSTLRYADRAKAIKTVAKVNETETNKLIQDLIKEKEQLLKELESQKGKKGGMDDEEMRRIRAEHQDELNRYKDEMKDNARAWEKRLEDARRDMEEARKREQEEVRLEKKTPHFSNLNEDPALMGKILHLIKPGKFMIGNGKEGTTPEICLNGPRIAKEHSEVENKSGKVVLTAKEGQVLHNGKELQKNESVELNHQDRMRFGSNNLFVFIHPDQAAQLKKKGKVLREITYEFAQSEIAKNSGLNLAEEDSILQQEVMSLMQLVQDVNAMAEEMEKSTEFNLMLVSAEARGVENGRTEVYISVHDVENGNEYLWDKNRFLNRQVLMQEMYGEFDETGKIPECEKERDPFWEPPDTEVIVGVVSVPLNYLSHMLDYGGDGEEPLTVIDYKAKQAGFLKVELIPCNKHGKPDSDLVVEDPMDLVNKDIAFKIKVVQAMNIPDRFAKTWCKYKFYHDSEVTKTDEGKGMNPTYNHSKLFRLSKNQVDHKLIDYLREKSMTIEIWGQQDNRINTGGKGAKRQERQSLMKELENYKKAIGEISDIAAANAKSPGMDKIRKIISNLNGN